MNILGARFGPSFEAELSKIDRRYREQMQSGWIFSALAKREVSFFTPTLGNALAPPVAAGEVRRKFSQSDLPSRADEKVALNSLGRHGFPSSQEGPTPVLMCDPCRKLSWTALQFISQVEPKYSVFLILGLQQ